MGDTHFNFTTPEVAKKSTLIKSLYMAYFVGNMANILLDLILIKATISNKSLHKSCTILIGVYFLCQMLYSMAPFIPFAIVILPSSILPSITMSTCSIINLLPATANFGIYTLTFVISLDRLISVYFPIWYSVRNSSKFYLVMQAILSISIPIYISISVIQNGIIYGNFKTLCTMFETLRDQLQLFNYFVPLCNITSMACYLVILARFIVKKFLNKNNSQSGTNNSASSKDLNVIKSLVLILCVQFLIWFFNTIFYASFFFALYGVLFQAFIGGYELSILTSVIVSLLSAMEVPILYFTSSLYRPALRKELNWLLRIFRRNVPAPQQNVATTTVMSFQMAQTAAGRTLRNPKISNNRVAFYNSA